jgi:hypothetical protein
MRPQRFRLPARVAIAAILATFSLPFLPLPVAAAGALSVTVHVGYQDVVKIGQWMPVSIDLRNDGGSLDGTLEVQQSIAGQPGVTGLPVYREPISLASGASKRVRVFLEIDTTGVGVTARITQNGRVIASQNSVPGASTSYVVGVLSDQTTTLDDLAAVHPASVAARVVHLNPADLPDAAIPLRAFDILAIDDFATDGLTTAQRTAVTDFVVAGGDLLIGTGASWHKTLAGLPDSILPMKAAGTAVIDTNATGGAAVEIATGSLTGGHVWLEQDGHPLLLDRTVGAGTVTLAAFDWNQAPVAVTASSNVSRQVLSRALFGSGGAGQNFSYGFGGIGGGGASTQPLYGIGASPSIASRSGALTPVLGNLPGLDLPSLQLTGVLVLLYVLIVGPVNYLVLGALHRRALAWVTVPAIAIIAAGGAYGTGVVTKGRSVQLNQVAILHLQAGSERAYAESYTGVIPPSRGDYVANVSESHGLISPIANGYAGPATSTPGLQVDLESNAITLTGMTAFSLGGFASESMTAAPNLLADISLENGRLVGTIKNASNLTFTDAVLISGDSFQKIAELKPGATAKIALTPQPSNVVGQPIYTQVYGNGQIGGNASDAEREALTKTQVLSLLPTGASFKGILSYAAPTLVAWTAEPFQNVRVNGSQPRSTSLTAVALSLPIHQIGTGPLPAGVVNSRIVDVVGDSQGNGPPGMLVLQNGSVTFEFNPALASGTRLKTASIIAQNPYSAKFVGAPGSTSPPQTVQGEIWDWSSHAWVSINYQDNGTTALPDNAINPDSGAIRVRVTSANGAFLAGSLTLSGTVQ